MTTVPNIEVRTSLLGKASLLKAFQDFVLSHGDDAFRSLALPQRARLVVDMAEETGTGVTLATDARGAYHHVRIGHAEAERVLLLSRAFHWANGMVVIPVAAALMRRGVLSQLTAAADVSARTLHEACARDSRQTFGHFIGALRLLALAGWLRISGVGLEAGVRLTPLGASSVRWLLSAKHTVALVLSGMGLSLNYRHHVFEAGLEAELAARHLCDLAGLVAKDWELPAAGADNTERRARQHVCEYLNGVALGPVLVAMGMPRFEKTEDAVAEVAPAVISRLAHGQTLEFAEASLNMRFVSAAFELLEAAGLARLDRQHGVFALREETARFVELAPPVLALPGSYYPSYDRIEQVLFDDPDPLGIAHDNHVDRIMNIYGSSGAGSGPASRVICQRILKRMFDETPLAEQPAGICDIGCGDGTALLSLADYIIKNTRRGRALHTHPLYVVGADFNDGPQLRTRETLRALETHSGVHTLVLRADVTRPEEFQRALEALEVQYRDPKSGQRRLLGLSDLVHSLMFLVHNRRLCIRDEQEARDILRHAVRGADRSALVQALAIATGGSSDLPETEDALLELLVHHFQTSFSDAGKLVPGFVVAADFTAFWQRWTPYARHGIIVLEGHSPWSKKMLEEPPASDALWMRGEKLPHPFNWGMHFLSGQYLLPYEEFVVGLALAGFAPRDGAVFGGLYADGIPSVDRLDEYRFLSIGCYRPACRGQSA